MYEKYAKYNLENIPSNKEEFTKLLNGIEEEFYSHKFKQDDRYVCVGRHEILIKEMFELYLTKEQCQKQGYVICPTIWCFGSLIEFMVNPNFLTILSFEKLKKSNNIYLNKSSKECQAIYDSYNRDGIISLNERDYILHVLYTIKDSLDKCDENMNWIN